MKPSCIEILQNDPHMATLTLNRPEKRNALSIKLMDELCTAIDQLQRTPCRVVVIAANGPAFSAGLDLNEAGDPALIESMATHVARTLTTLRNSPLISIAAVHGDAMAGGAGLAAACDLVVMGKGARLGYPEVRRGLVAALVATVLEQQVGFRAMSELLLTGEPVDAARALVMGLVNKVVDNGDVLKEATAMGEKVLLGAPEAVKLSKRLINDLAGNGLMDHVQHAMALHHAVRNSAEAKEGIAAFLDKRQPNWH